jgi:stress-induced morphogen
MRLRRSRYIEHTPRGKALVERHQMVYRALDPLMARIHAIQLKTVSPGEA